VARLTDQALVERIADPVDGRSFTVAATPAGRALLSKLRTRKNAYLARRLRRLDKADLDALERAAQILEQVLEGERR
jgi:DNA-binding MarR family transcriptional regulator